MAKNKRTYGDVAEDASRKENEADVTIPVTKTAQKCIFVSDGVYKYVDGQKNEAK